MKRGAPLKRGGPPKRSPFKRGNKFGAKPCTYNGYTYHSRLEADYAKRLDLLKKAADPAERVVSYQRQVNIPLVVNGHKICTWIADFEVTFADGHVEIREAKGFETPEWRIKEKLFRALYPERTMQVVGSSGKAKGAVQPRKGRGQVARGGAYRVQSKLTT